MKLYIEADVPPNGNGYNYLDHTCLFKLLLSTSNFREVFCVYLMGEGCERMKGNKER